MLDYAHMRCLVSGAILCKCLLTSLYAMPGCCRLFNYESTRVGVRVDNGPIVDMRSHGILNSRKIQEWITQE